MKQFILMIALACLLLPTGLVAEEPEHNELLRYLLDLGGEGEGARDHCPGPTPLSFTVKTLENPWESWPADSNPSNPLPLVLEILLTVPEPSFWRTDHNIAHVMFEITPTDKAMQLFGVSTLFWDIDVNELKNIPVGSVVEISFILPIIADAPREALQQSYEISIPAYDLCYVSNSSTASVIPKGTEPEVIFLMDCHAGSSMAVEPYSAGIVSYAPVQACVDVSIAKHRDMRLDFIGTLAGSATCGVDYHLVRAREDCETNTFSFTSLPGEIKMHRFFVSPHGHDGAEPVETIYLDLTPKHVVHTPLTWGNYGIYLAIADKDSSE